MPHSYSIPSQVLLDQGRLTLQELKSDGNQPGIAALERTGIGVSSLIRDLGKAVDRARDAEAEQERSKATYLTETAEDRSLAEEGFRWIQSLQTRVRIYLTEHPGSTFEYRTRFRFGRLPRARARGVAYELRVLIPEAEAEKSKLKSAGVDDGFIARGNTILRQLTRDREETTEAQAAREAATRAVSEAEGQLSDILRRLQLVDEVAAIENPEGKPWFPLNVIATERGRVEAARKSRVEARPDDALSPDDVAD